VITDEEIDQAHAGGYVACTQCGHPLDGHDENGCTLAVGEVPGCLCPIRPTDAELAAMLAPYGFDPDGRPFAHYASISDGHPVCARRPGEVVHGPVECDIDLVTCPACVKAGRDLACSDCRRPLNDPASHCPACGGCDCADLGCRAGGELNGDDDR
jgi:hypothetical protein